MKAAYMLTSLLPCCPEDFSFLDDTHKHCRYVGPDPKFRGHTGLVQRVLGKWRVQVDDLTHPAAYGWTRTNPRHWRIIKETPCV